MILDYVLWCNVCNGLQTCNCQWYLLGSSYRRGWEVENHRNKARFLVTRDELEFHLFVNKHHPNGPWILFPPYNPRPNPQPCRKECLDWDVLCCTSGTKKFIRESPALAKFIVFKLFVYNNSKLSMVHTYPWQRGKDHPANQTELVYVGILWLDIPWVTLVPREGCSLHWNYNPLNSNALLGVEERCGKKVIQWHSSSSFVPSLGFRGHLGVLCGCSTDTRPC